MSIGAKMCVGCEAPNLCCVTTSNLRWTCPRFWDNLNVRRLIGFERASSCFFFLSECVYLCSLRRCCRRISMTVQSRTWKRTTVWRYKKKNSGQVSSKVFVWERICAHFDRIAGVWSTTVCEHGHSPCKTHLFNGLFADLRKAQLRLTAFLIFKPESASI